MDAAPDESIDRVTRLVSHLLDVPVSLVSVVVPDRQFFASQTGLSEPWATRRETPLSHSFCQYVVMDDQPLVIEDANTDRRVAGNAAIAELGVVAYLGVPLRDPDGAALGSLCAIDHQPRQWSDRDLQTLEDLGGTLTTELRLRRLAEQIDREAETERATRQHAAHMDARRLRALADNAADVIYELRLHPEPHMAYINPAVEELTGISAETFLDEPERMAAIVHPDDLERIRQAQQRDPGGAVEFRVRGRDASWTWASARTHFVQDQDGTLIAVQGIIRDIEATKRREAALNAALEAQRHATDELQRIHEMRSGFLTAISHELRTPLTSVLGFADVLHRADATLTPDKRQMMLERLRANAHRLGDLLIDILDVQRLQANVDGRMETTETRLDVLADTFVRSLGPDSQVIELDLAPVTIRCHQERVKRVMGNVLENAIRHTRAGSTVLVAVRPTEEGAELVVQDHGPGISDERKPRVFEPFTQGPETAASPNPGTGIGLALVAEFVRAHGGEVKVEDAPGGGARFIVALPAEPPSP